MPPNPAQHTLGADDVVQGLYRAHAVGLVRLGLLLVGDRQSAEDVVQDAFMGLYQVLPYLRAAVVNGCRSVLRARRGAGPRATGGIVSKIEDRLRDAYRAATKTIQPETIPDVPGSAMRSAHSKARSRLARALISQTARSRFTGPPPAK